jgi:hypothetical protein
MCGCIGMLTRTNVWFKGSRLKNMGSTNCTMLNYSNSQLQPLDSTPCANAVHLDLTCCEKAS